MVVPSSGSPLLGYVTPFAAAGVLVRVMPDEIGGATAGAYPDWAAAVPASAVQVVESRLVATSSQYDITVAVEPPVALAGMPPLTHHRAPGLVPGPAQGRRSPAMGS